MDTIGKAQARAGERLFFVLRGVEQSLGPSATMGSKAHGLLRMAHLGLPIPPAFVLGTAVWSDYFAAGRRLPDDFRELLGTGLARLEQAAGRRFGNARHPLLVSVRSRAPVSMPGMMETLLNIGPTQQTLPGRLRTTGNPRLKYDCYRRLVGDFMQIVHGAATEPFDEIVVRQCADEGQTGGRELDSATLARIGEQSLGLALAVTGQPFAQSAIEQLTQGVQAVWRSSESEKAREYRRIEHIDDALGTAATVQAMVFGNAGASSGAGVGFTRDPATGEDRL